MNDLSVLKSYLRYDEATGNFFWLRDVSSTVKGGALAGRIASHGYRQIKIEGKTYYAHRLAWLFIHGQWPARFIDHINRNRSDNRIENLRVATPSQNSSNAKRATNNTSGKRGVAPLGAPNRWEAYITVEGKRVWLGIFDKYDDACNARREAEQNLLGRFAA